MPNRNLSQKKQVAIEYVIDGGGSVITTGQKGHMEVPFNMTITGWTILGDQVGSAVVDVWRTSYGGFPPSVANSITGGDYPRLVSAQGNRNLNLTLWTTKLNNNDVLAFNVNSATSVQRLTVSVMGLKD
jgi:hypothetical protein